MIYLLYGGDRTKARAKASEITESLKKKKPDAAFFHVNPESYDASQFEEYISGQGLFSNKYIIFLDSLFGDEKIKEELGKKIKDIGESENVFIFLEGKVNKDVLSKFEKFSEKVQLFEAKDVAEQKKMNIFSLGDALGKRDKKNLWMLFVQARMAGFEDEQIHGTLFWAAKNIMIAMESGSAKEAGMNPYVWSKSLGFSRNFNKKELADTLNGLVVAYHDARRGKLDLSDAVEKLILKM